uniref:Uncharacterized protein n=1 Tax=Anguilla anguilla TaxID=7936 RepID=A0A0E9VD30_ANGAN
MACPPTTVPAPILKIWEESRTLLGSFTILVPLGSCFWNRTWTNKYHFTQVHKHTRADKNGKLSAVSIS